MNTQTNELSESPLEPQPTAPAPISATRPLYWSVRRELWENRSIYMVPLIVAAVQVFGFAITTIGLADRRRAVLLLDEAHQRAAIEQPYDLAAMMMIFMLSLGGLPATGGFIGKWYLLWGLFDRAKTDGKTWYYWLAGWAVINIVVSFYYYLRFIKVMYLGDRIADDRPLELSPALRTALVASLVGILFIGVYPQPFIVLAQKLGTMVLK